MGEDDWHRYTGDRTSKFVAAELATLGPGGGWLLNAGAGVYELRVGNWTEISFDIFVAPISRRSHAVCGTVEDLPFRSGSLHVIVCVGEVFAYCDPARAIHEFARALTAGGRLICDFGSTRSAMHVFRKGFGRAAHIETDWYNGAAEKTWIYDPKYIASVLTGAGFAIRAVSGTHAWSALARRFGASPARAVNLQRRLDALRIPGPWPDVMTLSAVRAPDAK